MIEGIDYHRVNTPGYDDRQVAGKPLHAVEIKTNRSICGLTRRLWSFDMFNMDRCKRCARKLGLPWWHNGHEYKQNPYDKR